MNYIGLDLGTGAIKGVCFNREKGVLKSISKRVDFIYPADNQVEIDAAEYMNQTVRIINDLADGADGEIKGIAFAAASGNTLLCDADGNPQTPIISWLDKRLSDWSVPESWNVREVGGWGAIKTFPLMHLEYFKRTCPELLKKSHVAMNNDFLYWKLCGNHVLDRSNCAPFYIYDQVGKKYADYISYYDLSADRLPEVLPVGTFCGYLQKEFQRGNLTAQTALITGSFDHPAAARAVGVTEPGSMLLSCGTSWVGFYPAAKREDIACRELCDVFQSESGGAWGAMFSLGGVGVELEKFIVSRYGNAPSRYDDFNAEALSGSNPARDMMLSVICRFKERLDGRNVRKMVMCGGPSEGAAWLKLIESQLKIELQVSPYQSFTGAVGAAKIAGGMIK